MMEYLMKDDKTKEIMYVGDVGKPNTALSIHAQNMARLFGKMGYHTTFICDAYKGMNKISDETELFNYCYTSKFITIPKISAIEWLIDELTGWKYRKILKEKIRSKKPEFVLMYGYAGESWMVKYCHKKKIPFIVERVDWFEKSDRTGFIERELFQRQVDKTILKIDKHVDGVISISKFFEEYYYKMNVPTIFVPPIFEFGNNDMQNDPITILFIKSDLRLVVDLQNCIKAQQSRAYAQKVKISNLQQMAKTVAYIQEHGYDTQEKLQDTTDTIQSKMAKARSDAKLTEAKLKKVNEQIHYLGQYLSTKSVYADFLKSTNKKDFRQNYADEIAKYEEALQFLKQNSQDGKLPTMKDLRSEKELLVQQKSAQYETYQYFKDYHRELQTVCSNVENILNQPSVQKHATREFTL